MIEKALPCAPFGNRKSTINILVFDVIRSSTGERDDGTAGSSTMRLWSLQTDLA
jgi:hypothetical protein